MKYFTVAQASNLIGVSRMSVYNWIKEDKIDFIEIGGINKNAYAVPESEVKRLKNPIVKEAIKRTFKEYKDVLDKLADE